MVGQFVRMLPIKVVTRYIQHLVLLVALLHEQFERLTTHMHVGADGEQLSALGKRRSFAVTG